MSNLTNSEGYPNFGVVGMSIDPKLHATTKEQFAGISRYDFVFLDGRLAEYTVSYDPPPRGPRWLSVDDFLSRISAAFDLPSAAFWTPDPDIAFRKSLTCDGFQIRGGTPNFQGSLTFSTARGPFQVQQGRQAAYEEKIRREFKP